MAKLSGGGDVGQKLTFNDFAFAVTGISLSQGIESVVNFGYLTYMP